MRKILTIWVALVLFAVPVQAINLSSDVCVLTFTNITTLSTTATSCTGRCDSTKNCRIKIAQGESLQIEAIPNSYLHTATDWDIEMWTSDELDGPFKFYTDALTAQGSLTVIGGYNSTTDWTITVSGNLTTYAWDGDGGDPAPETATPNKIIVISGFTETGNNGIFNVTSSTASGNGSFTVYNPDGVADVDEGSATHRLFDGAASSVAGSMGITPGSNYVEIKISENASVAVYGTITATVRR